MVFAHARKWRRRLGMIEGAGTEPLNKLNKEDTEEVHRVVEMCSAMGIYADDLASRVTGQSPASERG